MRMSIVVACWVVLGCSAGELRGSAPEIRIELVSAPSSTLELGDAGVPDLGHAGCGEFPSDGLAELLCADGTDDDCDGLIDCADPDCEAQACADDGVATRDVCVAGACTHTYECGCGTCCIDCRCTACIPSCPAGSRWDCELGCCYDRTVWACR